MSELLINCWVISGSLLPTKIPISSDELRASWGTLYEKNNNYKKEYNNDWMIFLQPSDWTINSIAASPAFEVAKVDNVWKTSFKISWFSACRSINRTSTNGF